MSPHKDHSFKCLKDLLGRFVLVPKQQANTHSLVLLPHNLVVLFPPNTGSNFEMCWFQVSKISVLVDLRARSPASNWSRNKRDEMKAHESHRPQSRNQE
jgi:hypothetical protein